MLLFMCKYIYSNTVIVSPMQMYTKYTIAQSSLYVHPLGLETYV